MQGGEAPKLEKALKAGHAKAIGAAVAAEATLLNLAGAFRRSH